MAVGSLALVGSTVVWAPAGQAHEPVRTEGVVCTGPSTSTYDPPLGLLPQQTHVRTQASYTCGIAPGRTVPATGLMEGTSPGASCVTVNSPRLEEVVRYADGKRSSIVYDSSTSIRVAGVLVVRLSGRVVEGRGAGLSAHRIVAALPSELPTACLLSGLRGSGGEAQLEILP
ncbi:hypothetical protein [Streptomyces sp. NPDC017095]|uniref:hypothetical protein n=1 Tax=Streptomyces sp. NPDC017095 TaxID=3364977 RepID=UPI0037B4FD79